MKKSLALSATFIFAILFLLSILTYLSQPTAVYAATITVDTTLDEADDGECAIDCTLRDAIGLAADGDTISIPAGTYTLTLGQLELNDLDITLSGNDPSDTIIASGVISRVLYIQDGNVTLENLNITNGQEAQGAGIYATFASLTLSNTVIYSNTATDEGGGIYFDEEDATLSLINNSQVISNTATNAGGGLFVQNGTLTMENGNISYNEAGEGGGVYLQYNAIFNLNGGDISYNQTTIVDVNVYPGGGIHVDSGEAYLNGGQIINNSSYRGAGVMVEAGDVVQDGTLISNNTATYGGGVYVALPTAVFTQTSGNIQNNNSIGGDFGGGGLYIYLGTANLFGGEVTGNQAVNDGGGMELRLGRLNIDGSTITNNQAGHWGGAIFNSGGVMTVTNSTIQNNQAALGGGIATNVDDDGPSQNNISQSAILSNSATSEDGGGIHNRGELTLTNVTLNGNSANSATKSGGGLYNDISNDPLEPAGIATLTNVTLSSNHAAFAGGGLHREDGTLSIANTIVYGNTAVAGVEDCSGTITSNGYNLTGSGTGCVLGGTGDITGIPSLATLALNGGTTLNHAIGAGSPATNAGNPALCPATDQRGNPRPVAGVCDIGAYEYGVGYFIMDASVTETEATTTVDVTVLRSYDAAGSSVNFTLASDTAVAGTDYTDTSGTVNFAGGSVSETIQIDILGDVMDEFDETFVVNLNNPSAGTEISDGQAIVTIVDNDPEPTVWISDVTVAEPVGTTATDTITATFAVTLSAQSAKPITVSFTTNNATAVSGVDYVENSGTVSFAPGETSKEIEVTVNGDALDEFDETFAVNLSTVTDGNVMIGDGQGIGTITDNDAPPTISIVTTASETEVNNGATSTAALNVTLSAPSGKPISVTYNTMAGTATAGSDFVAATNAILNIAPGSNTASTVDITINGDNVYEGDQTFTVQLSNFNNVTDSGNNATTVTIEDNETKPTISIQNASLTEGDSGTTTMDFTVTLSGQAEEAVTVTYNTNHVTTDNSDMVPVVNGTVTFVALDTSETISITINGDEDSEDDETFQVNLSSPSDNATISGGQAIGTILDDDAYFIYLPMVIKP